MVRWTLRSIARETIETVRQMRDETGLPIGVIVNACVQLGAERARAHFEDQRPVDLHKAVNKALRQLREMTGAVDRLRAVLTDKDTRQSEGQGCGLLDEHVNPVISPHSDVYLGFS